MNRLSSTITIRDAEFTDLPAILRIYNQTIPDRNATCDLTPAMMGDRVSWYYGHGPRYPLWVALIEDRVVGWACISPYSDKAGYRQTVENSIYVDREVRGQGIGRRLMERTIEESSRLGYHAIVARVFTHNLASMAIHERHGFVEMGRLLEIARMDDVYRDVAFLVKILPDQPVPEME